MKGPPTKRFRHEGHRLAFDERGSGTRPVVLLPGLLLPRKMHWPLADALAEQGNRVICLDFLGHGEADRPRDMTLYSMPRFGDQVIALLDHLEIEEAVVGGTSLGANVALDVAAKAPERLRGAIVEMPVLDNALLGCAIAFSPLLLWLTFGEPVARVTSRLVGALPRGLHHNADVLIDWVGQDPAPSSAVLQGLFFGRVAPPKSEREQIETETLIIGHSRDPIHPFSDADGLVHELPHARLIEANSILELRISPDRLTGLIGDFVNDCWRPQAARAPKRQRRASA
jgi:pimeloyl-ACP methyl ester carboxylesterase